MAKEIFQIIVSHPKTKDQYLSGIADLFLISKTEQEAQEKLDLLLFNHTLPRKIAKKLNRNIKDYDFFKQHLDLLEKLNPIFIQYGLPTNIPRETDTFFSSNDIPF